MRTVYRRWRDGQQRHLLAMLGPTFLIVSAGLTLPGCRHDAGEAVRLDALIRRTVCKDPDKVLQRLREGRQDYLATLRCEHNGQVVYLEKRYVSGGSLVSDGCYASRDSQWERLYEVNLPGAIRMFKNLQRQVAHGHEYREEGLGSRTLCQYAITWGNHRGMTTAEGDGSSAFFGHVGLLDELDSESLELIMFDENNLLSIATCIMDEIYYFDEACMEVHKRRLAETR